MRTILIPLFLLLVLISCKEDEEPLNTFDKNDIAGTWIEQGYKQEYFDADNNKIFEENLDNTFLDKIEISEPALKVFYVGGKVDQLNYTLTSEDGKAILTIALDNFNSERNEITDFTDNTMVWQLERLNGTYRENGVRKTSHHYIRTTTFSK